jgi:hypothetical protein
MTTIQFETTPQVQFPLRLEYNLHKRFSNISSKTKIPMSTLGRLGITKFLDEIESKGITTVLQELETK